MNPTCLNVLTGQHRIWSKSEHKVRLAKQLRNRDRKLRCQPILSSENCFWICLISAAPLSSASTQARSSFIPANWPRNAKSLLVVPGGLVRSAAGQSVEHVGHGDDAGLQLNFSAGQPHWLDASIERLMVVGCDIPQQFHAAFPV